MKKRILLTLIMVLALAFVLVTYVSASTIYKDQNGQVVFSYETKTVSHATSSDGTQSFEVIDTTSGEFAKTDANGVHLTWYITQTTTENGNTVHTVVCIPTLQAQGYDTCAGTLNSSGAYSYSINKKKVVSASFPDNAGIKTFAFGAYGGHGTRSQNNILFCYLPNTITELDESMFQETPILTAELDFEAPMKSFPKKFAHAAYSLRGEVRIPDAVEAIYSNERYGQGTPFYRTYCLERISFTKNSQLKTVGSYAFSTSGAKYITLPDSVTTVGAWAMGDTGIIDSPFSEGSLCTTIGGRAFSDNLSLKTFIVPAGLTKVDIYGSKDYGPISNCPNIELVTFGNAIPANQIVLQSSFFGRAGIKKIIFPEGITHIPDRYFVSATLKTVKFPNTVETANVRVFESAYVEEVIFGASFKYFINTETGHQSFMNVAKGVKAIYLPASFYAEAPGTNYKISYAFVCDGANSADVDFFFTGTKAQLEASITIFKAQSGGTENNWRFTGATQVDYADYILDTSKYGKGNYIIYNYNVCDAFYESIHNEDNNACVINCDRCKVYGQMEKEPVHIHTTTIKYENGYTALGVITSKCQNEGCVENTTPATTVAEAIFGAPQYALKKEGIGIVFEFEINTGAVSVYNEIAENDLEYGVLAVFKDKVNEPFVNGEKQNGVASIQIPSNDITRVDFVIIGENALWNMPHPTIENKTTKDRELYMLAYVKDANGVSYFNDLSYGNSASNVGAITYNSLLARTEQ